MYKIEISLKRSITFVLTNPKLKFIFVIRFWPTAINITAIQRQSHDFTVNFLCGHFERLSWYDCTYWGKQNNVKIKSSSS